MCKMKNVITRSKCELVAFSSLNKNSKSWCNWCKFLSSNATMMAPLLLLPLQMQNRCCLHLLFKLETSKFEVRFAFIQSFSYCYLPSKCKACIGFVSSLNAHLGCYLYFCFVSKHKGRECLCFSSTHYLGFWVKPLHSKVCNFFSSLNFCHLNHP